MWITKWILGATLIILVLGFALQNQYQMVQVRIIHWISPELPLYFIVYISFAFGLFTWLFTSIFKIMQLKSDFRQLKKQNQNLQDELNNLRNLSLNFAFILPALKMISFSKNICFLIMKPEIHLLMPHQQNFLMDSIRKMFLIIEVNFLKKMLVLMTS